MPATENLQQSRESSSAHGKLLSAGRRVCPWAFTWEQWWSCQAFQGDQPKFLGWGSRLVIRTSVLLSEEGRNTSKPASKNIYWEIILIRRQLSGRKEKEPRRTNKAPLVLDVRDATTAMEWQPFTAAALLLCLVSGPCGGFLQTQPHPSKWELCRQCYLVVLLT